MNLAEYTRSLLDKYKNILVENVRNNLCIDTCTKAKRN